MRYRILKNFKGSPTGSTAQDYLAGSEVELTPYLVSCVPADWIQAIDESAPAIENKAIATDGTRPARKRKGTTEPAPIDDAAAEAIADAQAAEIARATATATPTDAD